jgi:hypothetical protein
VHWEAPEQVWPFVEHFEKYMASSAVIPAERVSRASAGTHVSRRFGSIFRR